MLNVPDNLQWVPNTLAKSLGHQLLPMDLVPWLNARDIRLAPEVAAIGAEVAMVWAVFPDGQFFQ